MSASRSTPPSLLASILGAFSTPKPPAPAPEVLCPVCEAPAPYLDAIDFNRCCEEARGLKLPDSGTLVRYHLCERCGFCFAPEFASWTFEDFERRIYNADYAKVDPDYLSDRPRTNAIMIDKSFGAAHISHLDYGGGSGILSRDLSEAGWQSRSYDPFAAPALKVQELGKFDLVTAFEVFEHVPDVNALFADLERLTKPESLVIFSTALSDGHIGRGRPLDWPYAAPRNGHISLFSGLSLQKCFGRYGFKLGGFSSGLFVAFRKVPDWAGHVLKM